MASILVRSKKEQIVGVCGRCGQGVYIEEDVYRICGGCGSLTLYCECEELPITSMTEIEKTAVRSQVMQAVTRTFTFMAHAFVQLAAPPNPR